ncbi:MAG: hypothetical protein AAGU05_15240 [Anaerolineaceae bacterium]
MSPVKKVGSLEIVEDLKFQKWEWDFERAGWVVMAVLVLLGVLGLFGDGRISQAEQTSPGGLKISYERFERRTNPTLLELEFPPEAVQNGQLHWWINREYVKRVQVDGIFPDPEQVETTADRIIYTVNVPDAAGPILVKLNVSAEKSGRLPVEIGWLDGDTLQFNQFIFP